MTVLSDYAVITKTKSQLLQPVMLCQVRVITSLVIYKRAPITTRGSHTAETIFWWRIVWEFKSTHSERKNLPFRVRKETDKASHQSYFIAPDIWQLGRNLASQHHHGYCEIAYASDGTSRFLVITTRHFLAGELVQRMNPDLSQLMESWASWNSIEGPREIGYELPTYGIIRAVEGDRGFQRFRATVAQAASGEAVVLHLTLTGDHPILSDPRKCREYIAESLNSGFGKALQRAIHWSGVLQEKATDGDQTIGFFRINATFNSTEALKSPHVTGLLNTLQQIGSSAVKLDTVQKWFHLLTLDANGRKAALKGVIAMSERQEVVTLRAFSAVDPTKTFDILHSFCEEAYGEEALTKLRTISVFSGYSPRLRQEITQFFSFDQELITAAMLYAIERHAGTFGLPLLYDQNPVVAQGLARLDLPTDVPKQLQAPTTGPAAYDEFASMASLPNKILRRNFDVRPTPAGPSHDFSFLYGGPYSAFVKTMLVLMLIDHFASINAPAMYLDSQFWMPIILFRVNSARDIIRVFIAVTPGIMAAGVFNALFNKCIDGHNQHTPMRLVAGLCRCLVCYPNCGKCARTGHLASNCPHPPPITWQLKRYLCPFCNALCGPDSDHNFLLCRAFIQVSNPTSSKGCSICQHYSHEFPQCPIGLNPDGSFSEFTALLEEAQRHPEWQFTQSSDLTLQRTPVRQAWNIAMAFPITPERASTSSQGSSHSSQLTRSITPDSDMAIVLRDALSTSLRPLEEQLGLLQKGFVTLNTNISSVNDKVDAVSNRVDQQQAFLDALNSANSLNSSLRKRAAPVEEPKTTGSNA